MAAKKKATAKKTATKKSAAKKMSAGAAPAKKAAAKKTATKKTAGKKASAKKVSVKTGDKPPTKSEVMNQIAEQTGLSRKEVISVFDALQTLIQANLAPRGPGTFSVPGLAKIRVNKKAATKARKGINPFTGEETMFKAKPARKVVKVVPLKNLKDMV